MDNVTSAIVPTNSDTVTISYNKRFIISDPKRYSPIVYQVSKIEDTIYPLYTPKDTKLKNQEIIKTSNGERLIQTFNGESSFTLIQETNNNLEYTNTFCEREPIILNDVTGYIDDYSITWYDDNYSYYIVSKDLSQNELLQIASSITSPTIIK